MPDNDNNGNGTESWRCYQHLVLERLQAHEDKLTDLDREQNKTKTELAVICAKFTVWGILLGAGGGLVVTIIAQLLIHFMTKG